MTPEQLELAITHYLDGTLPSEEIGALEQILGTDPVAHGVRDEHEKLTAILRSQPLPELDMAELAHDLSAVVTGTVDEASRAQDQKLNAILKAATPLPAVKWDQLALRISAALDAEISMADEEDARLDAVLQSAPMPALNWEKFASHISKTVAAEAGAREREEERPAVIGRIGFARTASRWAVAACLLGAAAVGIQMYTHHPAVHSSTPIARVLEVETPKAETSSQPAVAEISIGPSKAYADVSDQEFYHHGVASRSPMVIAVPVGNDDDTDHVLGFD